MAVYYVVQTVAGSPLCLVNPPSGRLKTEGLETPSIPTHPSDLDTSGIARSKRNEENETTMMMYKSHAPPRRRKRRRKRSF